MKWFFIILLLVNCLYLGWEMDRESKFRHASYIASVKVPPGTPKLNTLNEMSELPNKRNTSEIFSDITLDSEPVMPIDLNPNTEDMLSALTPEKMDPDNEPLFQSDNPTEDIDAMNEDTSVCYTYGPIANEKESSLLIEWLDSRGMIHQERQTNEQGKQLFWVYLAPQESKEKAQAAFEDLKKKGINDIRLIQSGDLLNAISLGIFSNQLAVNRRLQDLKTKGYKAVVVPYSKNKLVFWVDVSVVKDSAYINELFSGLPARFSARPVSCDQIAMQDRKL